MKVKKSFGYDRTKEEFVKRSTGRPSKADLSRNQGAGRKNLRRRNGTVGEKQNLEEMLKERVNAKITALGDVTRIAVSGSRTSELETEVLSGDVDDRRVTKDAAIAGSEFTRKANGGVYPKNEAEGKVSSVDKEVSRNQENKGTEETTAVKNDHNSGNGRGVCRV